MESIAGSVDTSRPLVVGRFTTAQYFILEQVAKEFARRQLYGGGSPYFIDADKLMEETVQYILKRWQVKWEDSSG